MYLPGFVFLFCLVIFARLCCIGGPAAGAGPYRSCLLKEMVVVKVVPSGKLTKNYGKSPFLMGTSTISMAIFNSKL